MMPKPVTIHDPWVQLAADMGRQDMSEELIHPHFTNIQHALRLARQNLATCDTPNRQIVLITDGLQRRTFEEQMLYMLYLPILGLRLRRCAKGHFARRKGSRSICF